MNMMGMGGMNMMGMGGMNMMGMGGMMMGMAGGGMLGGGIPGAINCLGFNQFNGGLGMVGATMNQGLILLIQQLVAPGEWGPQRCRTMQPLYGFPGNNLGIPGGTLPGGPPPPTEEGGPAADIRNSNTIGFYAPALALVVRGTSRIHTNLMGGLVTSKKPADAGEVGVRPGRVAAVKPDKGKIVDVANAQGEDLDPTKVWQEALAQGVEDPGLIIACADFLFEHGKFEHAAEFLKADLRQGILVRPWVYEALAIALEASKTGSPEEIQRARLSAIALDPQDARGYLKAARAVADQRQYTRALAFCKEAAKLEPNSPHPYADALAYAEQGKDADGMAWAAGGLLSQEWPADGPRLHLTAQARLDALAADLDGEQHKADAERLRGVVGKARRRDLVVKLIWEAGVSGAADLELEVKEPCGSVCSSELRQSPGGGAWTGNLIPVSKRGAVTVAVDESLKKPFATYAAARAFPGTYEVTVRRIWGAPLGGRARLEIIQHQGTPDETRRIETVRVDNKTTLKVTLKDGRRTQVAPVAPDATVRRAELKDEVVKERRILEKLRDIADPYYAGEGPARMSGGVGLARYGVRAEDVGARTPTAEQLKRKADEQPVFQGAVAPLSGWSGNLTTTATVSADRRYVRLNVSPVFVSGFGSGLSRPTFNLSSIPGGVVP
jgi:tetratricopeptide (TPR) repeat protein